MKKNIKKLASIAFVALLATGCNGSEITKEQANERVAGIAKYQKEHAEDLYSKGVYLKGRMESKSTDGKEHASITSEVWMAKSFFHVRVNGNSKDEKGETKESQDIYVGEKDDHFYYVDTIAKKYYDFGSVGETVLTSVNKVLDEFETVYQKALSSSNIDEILSEFPDGEASFENGYSGVLKSKGEGHLYLELSYKSEDEKTSSSNIMIFNNYRFASAKVETKSEKETSVLETTASYSVSARMPGLNGMEKTTVLPLKF